MKFDKTTKNPIALTPVSASAEFEQTCDAIDFSAPATTISTLPKHTHTDFDAADEPQKAKNDSALDLGWGRLWRLSLVAMVNEAAGPAAQMITVAMIAHAGGTPAVAAYSAVMASITFCVNLFNFLISVTMAQVGSAVGAKNWVELGGRVRAALLLAAVVGVVCAVVLMGLQRPIELLLALPKDVAALAFPFWRITVIKVPLIMAQRVSSGLLAGYQRIVLLAALNLTIACAEVAAQAVALFTLGGGLVASGWASVATAGMGVVLVLVVALGPHAPPAEGQGQVQVLPCQCGGGGGGSSSSKGSSISNSSSSSNGSGSGSAGGSSSSSTTSSRHSSSSSRELFAGVVSSSSNPDTAATATAAAAAAMPAAGDNAIAGDDDDDDDAGRCGCCAACLLELGAMLGGEALREYVRASGNMMVRSLMLQVSVWGMSVCAARLGTTVLAAHQIVVMLWILTSYICDGFADVGTMLGSRLCGSECVGVRPLMKLLSMRLLAMGLATGVTAMALLLALQGRIIGLFTKDQEVETHLRRVWLLLSCMQVPNSLTFVYDGLLFATQAFQFVRNAMLVGALCIFGPALAVGYEVYGTLLSLWVAKSLLNFWRVVSSAYWINWHCWRIWARDEKELFDEAGVEAAVESDGSLELVAGAGRGTGMGTYSRRPSSASSGFNSFDVTDLPEMVEGSEVYL